MIGKVLGNRYEILEKIGGGGMALVYKAKCRLLNRYVAVKVLRPEFIQDDEFIRKFKRESQAAASLSHHNIVNIYDVGFEEGMYYIVMEYINGKTLKDYIKEQGKLSVDEALNVAIQISEALNHAHKNKIIHRDIKPHNIMVNEYGEIKVMDFGIARATSSNTIVDGGDVIGSVHYFSPEQARGGYTDEKSDIYSLGIVLYEMVYGHVPFEGDTPINVALKQVQQDIEFDEYESKMIPAGLIQIIKKCVQKEQAYRYQSAMELVNDLRRVKYNKDETIVEDHDAFENSPTMIMKPIKEELTPEKKLEEAIEKQMVKKETVTKKDAPKKQKVESKPKVKTDDKKMSDKSVKIIAVVSALIVAVVIFVVGTKVKGLFSSPGEVEMPYLVGLTQEIAQEKMDEQGLILKVREEKFDEKYKEGTIIWQSVAEATKVKSGFTIEVDISKGYKFIEMPDLSGKNTAEANTIITQLGLLPGEVKTEASDKPEGIIISQFPAANERIKEGTPVDYVLSQGSDQEKVMMPNLVGLTLDQAKKQLAKEGLSIGTTKNEVSATFEKDKIMNQLPNAGDEVTKDTKVNLVISSGTDATADPNKDSGKTTDTGKDTKKDNTKDTKKGVGKITLILPKKETTNVKIYKVVGEKEELLYNQDMSYNENGVDVILHGTGTIQVKVYYDDVEKGIKDIVFREE